MCAFIVDYFYWTEILVMCINAAALQSEGHDYLETYYVGGAAVESGNLTYKLPFLSSSFLPFSQCV